MNPVKGVLNDIKRGGMRSKCRRKGTRGKESWCDGGEVVVGSITIEVKELRVNFHGDEALGDAVCKEEVVFIGDGEGRLVGRCGEERWLRSLSS